MKLFNLGCFIVLSLFWESLRICNADGGGNWVYHKGLPYPDPEHWKEMPGSSCGGRRQSPIDITTKETSYLPSLQPIILKQLETVSKDIELHKGTTTLKLDFNDNWKISFGNDGCLKPLSVHWHWGSDNTKGSEHSLNGKMFPLEGHLVSYNCDIYKTAEEAMKGPSGLYVIGFFYEIGKINEALERMLVNIAKLKSENSVSMPEISPIEFLPKNLDNYYRYEGSLTTPPCTENVIWTVMNEILPIGESQMEIFRNLKYGLPEHGKMVDNFRPTNEKESRGDYIERVVYASSKKMKQNN